MPTTKQIFHGSYERLRTYAPRTSYFHLAFWLMGLIIINLPGLKLTFGNFHSDDYSLLLPSIYGVLLNAFLFYGSIYLINQGPTPSPKRTLQQSFLFFGGVTFLESQLDALYYVIHYGSIDLPLYLDILIGSFLMNAIFFYCPALLVGSLQRWSKQSVPPQRISVKDGQQEVYLTPEEVIMIESDRNYAIFHTARGRLLQRTTLTRLEAELPQQFTRCHRSFIVNQYHIEKRSALEVVIGGKTIPIGRKYKGNLNTVLTR